LRHDDRSTDHYQGAVCGPADDVPAALERYDAQRRPRSQQVARAALQIGRFGQRLSNPVAVRPRNALLRLTPPKAALRSMSRYVDWHTPNPTDVAQRIGN
jgi:2-polyprenyl-6-methoxyphenol hydroxylase-like FAD-dependent oxidoreductase